MTIVSFGIILLIIGLIITGTGGVWLIARRRGRRQRTQKVSSSGVRREMINKDEEEYRFTPRKVLIYCLIVGLTSAILSILIDGLRLLSMAAFVFASITIWYMFIEKLHRWKEKEKTSNTHELSVTFFAMN